MKSAQAQRYEKTRKDRVDCVWRGSELSFSIYWESMLCFQLNTEAIICTKHFCETSLIWISTVQKSNNLHSASHEGWTEQCHYALIHQFKQISPRKELGVRNSEVDRSYYRDCKWCPINVKLEVASLSTSKILNHCHFQHNPLFDTTETDAMHASNNQCNNKCTCIIMQQCSQNGTFSRESKICKSHINSFHCTNHSMIVNIRPTCEFSL